MWERNLWKRVIFEKFINPKLRVNNSQITHFRSNCTGIPLFLYVVSAIVKASFVSWDNLLYSLLIFFTIVNFKQMFKTCENL